VTNPPTILDAYYHERRALPLGASADDVLAALRRSGGNTLELVAVAATDPVATLFVSPEGPAFRCDVTPLDAVPAGELRSLYTIVNADLELTRLRDQSRQSLRQSQKVARQLHQIVTASLNSASSTTPGGVLRTIVRAARSIFDADRALIVLTDGTFAPLSAIIERGQLPRSGVETSEEFADWPTPLTPSAVQRIGSSVIAPLGDQRTTTKGVVIVTLGQAATDDDNELLALIASIATSTLASLGLYQNIVEAQERLRRLVDATPVAIIESSSEGAVTWSNETAQRLMGWASGAVPAWPAELLVPLHAMWQNARLQETTIVNELGPLVVNGRSRIFRASVARIGHDGAVISVLDDVTDQRTLREEVQAAQGLGLKGEVASAIAHDFNNLLTLITGFSELLRSHLEGNDEGSDLLASIITTSTRAAGLTAQLQRVGRATPITLQPLDINATLRASAEILERVVGSDIDVVWSLSPESAMTTTDPDQFEQTVLNLAMNARDAMTGGGVLTVTTRMVTNDFRAPTDGDYVMFQVSDTGSGMDEATMARCFEPLFSTKGALKGTGMGLAGARRLVEESGGSVDVSSVVGEGTTFTFYFPVIDGVAPTLPRESARQFARVGVVDDDSSVRQLMIQLLGRNGYDAIEFTSAREVLESEELATFDLLVSDVVMPETSGLELARQLGERYPDLAVLLVSGTASADDLNGLSPLVSFLAKPFRPSTFVDAVHQRLAERH
jgi:signal transduction histidine kinase